MSTVRKLLKQAVVASVLAATSIQIAQSADSKPSTNTAALAARVAELEAKVAYLSDRQQIHDVYLRYMRGFDRNDVELLRSAFWPGVQINYGTQSNSFDEFVVRHLNYHTKEFAHYAHLITNETVDVAGDVAHVETYVTAFFSKKDGKTEIGGGRYIDRLERRNGEWRIAIREFIPHLWTETNTVLDSYSYFKEPDWVHSGCGMGTWDKRDPSYRRPLNPRPDKDADIACAE